MTRPSHKVPFALAVAFAALLGSAAQAQTVPPNPQPQQDVRTILKRAETQAQRRSVGELLGGIAGVGQAQAQTAPAQAPPAQAAQPNPAPAASAGDATPQPQAVAQAP